MNELLSTEERIRILAHLFAADDIRVSKVAAALSLSKGLVSKYYRILQAADILGDSYKIKDSPQTKAAKIFLTLNIFSRKLFQRKPIVSAGLYGSCARGTNTKDSDIDIWVYTEAAGEQEKAALSKLFRAVSEKLSVLYLNKEKLALLKEENPSLYSSLVFGSIALYGEPLENI